jgi:phenylacetate-CoA ligase
MAAGHSGRDAATFAIKHLLLPLWTAKNRSKRLRYLAELERSQYWSAERLAELRTTRLREIVTYAARNCPYYERRLREAGIEARALRFPDDLRRLPTLTKQDVQDHRAEMISREYSEDSLLPDMTGGSTGSPMKFYYSEDRLDSREAAALRHNRWGDWDLGERAAALWGAPRDTQSDVAR